MAANAPLIAKSPIHGTAAAVLTSLQPGWGTAVGEALGEGRHASAAGGDSWDSSHAAMLPPVHSAMIPLADHDPPQRLLVWGNPERQSILHHFDGSSAVHQPRGGGNLRFRGDIRYIGLHGDVKGAAFMHDVCCWLHRQGQRPTLAGLRNAKLFKHRLDRRRRRRIERPGLCCRVRRL